MLDNKYYNLYFRIGKWCYKFINCRYNKGQWQYPILIEDDYYKPFFHKNMIATKIIKQWENLPSEAQIYAIAESSFKDKWYYNLV